MRPLYAPHLKDLVPYVPGKPIEETEREYGVTNIAKLASNENCLGPSPLALAAMQAACTTAHLYPDAGAFYLKQRLLKRHASHNVTADQLVIGNGTNEILTLLVRALVGEGEAVAVGWPSFIVYRLAAMSLSRRDVSVPLDTGHQYDLGALLDACKNPSNNVKVVFIANPNNPTGRHIGQSEFQTFVDGLPDDIVLVIDEAYNEYVTASDYPDGLAVAQKRPRTVLTRTFSKIFGLAAVRTGYAVCDPEIADVLNRIRDPFNVNTLGQVGAVAALDDDAHIQASVQHNERERARLATRLEALGLGLAPSQCNFILASLPDGPHAMSDVQEQLLRRAVIVRPMGGYGLPNAARITVGTAEENDRLIAALTEVLTA